MPYRPRKAPTQLCDLHGRPEAGPHVSVQGPTPSDSPLLLHVSHVQLFPRHHPPSSGVHPVPRGKGAMATLEATSQSHTGAPRSGQHEACRSLKERKLSSAVSPSSWRVFFTHFRKLLEVASPPSPSMHPLTDHHLLSPLWNHSQQDQRPLCCRTKQKPSDGPRPLRSAPGPPFPESLLHPSHPPGW